MRLLRAELERFRSRAVLWLVAGLLLLTSAGYVILAWDRSAPPSEAELAAQNAEYVDAVAFWSRASDDAAEACREHSDAADVDPQSLELLCSGLPAPELSDFLPAQPGFADVVPESLAGMTIPLVVAALAMGVSFVAAEFATGSMSTWLTFVPRRDRVVATKTAAAAVGAVPVLLAAQAAVLSGAVLVFLVRGLPLGDAVLWSDLAVLAGRQVVLAVLAAIGGAALAFAVRHAAAVTGLLVWWFVAVEVTLPVVLPRFRAATLVLQAQAWIDGAASFSVDECTPDPADATLQVCDTAVHTVGAAQGGVVLLAVVAALVALGFAVFRRRDVA